MNVKSITEEWQSNWQQLCLRWQETAAVWNDPVRFRFEQEYLQNLEAEVKATHQEMARLAAVIQQAQREVK